MNKVSFKPFGIHVILERIPKEEKSDGGIILPEITQETHAKAKVVAVGDGYRNSDGTFTPMTVKVGDVVYFSLHAGAKVNHKGKEYTIIQEPEMWFKEV